MREKNAGFLSLAWFLLHLAFFLFSKSRVACVHFLSLYSREIYSIPAAGPSSEIPGRSSPSWKITDTAYRSGCSTSGANKTATKRSLRANASSGTSPRPPTCSPRRDSAQKEAWSDTISGRATSMSASSGELKQERVPKRRHSDTAWMVLTKLRVNLGLPIVTMAE